VLAARKGGLRLLAGVPAIIGLITLAIRWEPIGVDIENEPIDLDLRTEATVDLPLPAPV
jgi:hypothetical protein